MRPLRLFVPLLVVVLALAGCSDGPNAPDGPIDVSLVLAPGDTVGVTGTAYRLRFDGVVGESRCPGDAICIQGGDAIVRLRVLTDGGADASYELHTGNLEPARHGNVTIALTELTPYPFGSLPSIKPGDYRATLRITR